MLRKVKWQIPGEPLAARYSCCQGPAVEKHCTRHIFQQFFSLWPCSQTLAMASSFLLFLDYTRRATVVRTPLDRWSARHRDLYITTHGTCNRQQKKIHAPIGFEPTFSAGERPQTYALDRAATGTGIFQQLTAVKLVVYIFLFWPLSTY